MSRVGLPPATGASHRGCFASRCHPEPIRAQRGWVRDLLLLSLSAVWLSSSAATKDRSPRPIPSNLPAARQRLLGGRGFQPDKKTRRAAPTARGVFSASLSTVPQMLENHRLLSVSVEAAKIAFATRCLGGRGSQPRQKAGRDSAFLSRCLYREASSPNLLCLLNLLHLRVVDARPFAVKGRSSRQCPRRRMTRVLFRNGEPGKREQGSLVGRGFQPRQNDPGAQRLPLAVNFPRAVLLYLLYLLNLLCLPCLFRPHRAHRDRV